MNIDNGSLLQTVRSHLHTSRQQAHTATERLSSGSRLNHAKDDAAGLAIANQMGSQINALSQTMRNASDGLGLATAAESGLDGINDRLQQARELSIAARNDTLSDADRNTIAAAIHAQLDAIDQIAGQSQFNGIHLLDGSRASARIQVGRSDGDLLHIDLARMDTQALGLRDDLEHTPPPDPPATSPLVTPGGFHAHSRTAADDAVFAFEDGGRQTYGDYDVVRASDGGLYVRDADDHYYRVHSAKVTNGNGSVQGPESDNGNTVEIIFNSDAPGTTPPGLPDSPTMGSQPGPPSGPTLDAGQPRADGMPSLQALDGALEQVDRFRGSLGATQNRIDATLTGILDQKTILTGARSRVMDADYAQESTRLASARLLEEAGISVLAQANQARRYVVSLLG